MKNILRDLFCDEAGFIISAEMVLVVTICGLGMIVGLSEVAFNINQELEDVGSAFGSINHGFYYNGTAGHKGSMTGTTFTDEYDYGDTDCDVICDVPPSREI